ncbi:MAG: LysM peptidoglycan-binding domain-containing protein [Cyclobacteriaceae bacterium]|nr:LysM peptidoglycan-binding domain-containing protein [Cyclobacteriaceae bacterium]
MIKLLVLVSMSFLNQQVQQDSIGTETINGKIFVIHKVGEKETLYGISRRYGATVEAIQQANPDVNGSLEIGQILKVPYTPKTAVRPSTGGGFIHVVAAKETMFSISRAYGITMEEIKQWNNLSDITLSVGQELVIKKRNTVTNSTVVPQTQPSSKKGVHTVESKETMYSIARQYNVTVQQLKEWNNLQGNELSIGQVLMVVQPERGGIAKTPEVVKETAVVVKESTPPVQQPTTPVVKEQTQTIHISESVKSGDEVNETGLAELIEGTEGNRKYLALHRTAPVGTILKIRNEMNNREVFVRVMGKLPDTALTDKLIIKISKSAYDRLGAIDPRFRVQVTYYK